MRRLRCWLAMVPVLGVVACAQPLLLRPEDGAVLRPAAGVHRFNLEGRLQVKDGERLVAVGLVWAHEGERDDWLFSGPLGQGLARIESTAGGAILTLSDGRRMEASSPAELGESVLGLQAPFDGLATWVTGRLRPGAEVRELDSAGRPRRVVDQGWTIEYLDYAGDGPDDLPRKIDVHRGDTRLRLVIDAWNV